MAKERRTSYSREFKIRLVKQALQPGAVVARIAREHGINDNLLLKWKSQYEDGLLSDDDIQECMPVPVALTDTPEPTRPVTNPSGVTSLMSALRVIPETSHGASCILNQVW